jgi:hypothetical protein
VRDRTSSTIRGPLARHLGVALALGLGLLSAGCGAASRTPLSARAPGTTTILVGNQLDPRDELDHLRVSVDDAVLPLATVPPRGEVSAALGTLRLAPGPHDISVRLTTHGEDAAIAVVDARLLFHLDGRASEIDITLRSRPRSSDFDARVAIELSMQGGHLSPEIGAPPVEGKDARCAPLQPVPRALCRAAADLDEASRRNDLVGALCIREKLGEMRKLSLIGETSTPEVATMATERVRALEQAIGRCAGDVVIGKDGLTVIKPGASPTPPRPPRLPASQFPAPSSTARL